MIESFKNTGERYIEHCVKNKYAVSDFIRRTFRNELQNLVENEEDDPYIFMKLCGNNKVVTSERILDKHMKGFCEVLVDDISIKSIDLRFNRISDLGAEFLSISLSKNMSLLELNLMGNDIGEEGAKHLGSALTQNKTLKILKLTGNKIGCEGGMHLARALQINDTLEDIDLGECDLKTQSVIAFATLLKCNPSLKSVNLDRPLLFSHQEETTVHMENMLYQNTTLEELHLSKHGIRDFGMERLCDALILNTSLRILDLSSNRITRDGAKILARVLAKNPPLRVLDLSYNRIHDTGVTEISKAISYCNTNLKTLVIQYNEIGEEGLLEILRSLDLNVTLERLYIWGNAFTSKVCEELNRITVEYRLMESQTDVRPYCVDQQYYVALLPHNVDFRMYRYNAPIYGDNIPTNRSFAVM